MTFRPSLSLAPPRNFELFAHWLLAHDAIHHFGSHLCRKTDVNGTMGLHRHFDFDLVSLCLSNCTRVVLLLNSAMHWIVALLLTCALHLNMWTMNSQQHSISNNQREKDLNNCRNNLWAEQDWENTKLLYSRSERSWSYCRFLLLCGIASRNALKWS